MSDLKKDMGKVHNWKDSRVPRLRFPEFEGEWEEKKLGEVCEVVGGGTPETSNEKYWNGNIQWFTPTEIKSNYVETSVRTITELGLKKSSAKLLPKGTILLTTRATIGEAAIANLECTTNQGFQSLIVNKDTNNIFLLNWIRQNKNELTRRANGSTFSEISKSEIESIHILIPLLNEQEKIANFLIAIENRIETQNKIIEGIKSSKVISRHKLFSQINNDKNELIQIKDILEYEQPTKYLVTNTDYLSDSKMTPVLTANKAFILGYTQENFGLYNKGECIIFDDFTMDMKFVDFEFKVKSSAIKILTPKPSINLRFIFEYLSFLELSSTEHKRHYISEVENIKISEVGISTQNNIANFMTSLDQKLRIERLLLKSYEKQKQYLLQNLFI